MYGQYLTAKVQAERAGNTIEKLILDSETYQELLGPQNDDGTDRLVRESMPDTAPVRFGLSGDFDVVEGEDNVLVTDDGVRRF